MCLAMNIKVIEQKFADGFKKINEETIFFSRQYRIR